MRKYATGQALLVRFFIVCRAVDVSFLGETNAWFGKTYARLNV
ncbi:MAG: hypothetical protein ACJA2U_000859 [Marinomonas primoryensis]|jgi:hypothetical protein